MLIAKPKIVITGADGMLGSMLGTVLSKYQPVMLNRAALDITNWDNVVSVITQHAPNMIINAAAYTMVDACETQFNIASQVNAVGPGFLAMMAKSIDATLIQYSTDYIFNGKKREGYTEHETMIDPINAYGKTKAQAEERVMHHCSRYYIIRTAWLYGPNGKNFVDTMLQLSKIKSELNVVNDQHGSPTYTKDLAEQTKYMIEQSVPYGVYHVTNNGSCTWFEFAQEIFKFTGITTHLQPCNTAEFPRPAKRPEYSILFNTKLPPLRSWQEGLAEYLHYR